MMERVQRTLDLAGMCWKVLMLDKEMLLFPIFSFVTLALVASGIFYPLWANGQLDALIGMLNPDQQPEKNPAVWAIIFASYFVTYFIMVFFNTALITCALIRFAGGNPTVFDGLKASMSRLPQIFGWSLVSATIGVLLSMIENRSNGVARFFATLIGTGWAVATYFVIPVLVIERVGPIQAIKDSVSAIKKTWGESLLGHVGLGLINYFGFAIASLFFIAGIIRIEDNLTLGIIWILLSVTCVVLFTLVTTTLSAILRAGLYVYAIEGSAPLHFDSRLIKNAF